MNKTVTPPLRRLLLRANNDDPTHCCRGPVPLARS
jgi:hypothetical protein